MTAVFLALFWEPSWLVSVGPTKQGVNSLRAHSGDHTLPQMTKTHSFIKEPKQKLPDGLRVSRHAAAWVANEFWEQQRVAPH